MYLSADRQEAINLGLRELIVNVQDEYEIYKPQKSFRKSHAKYLTREITVEDNMRGIPVGMREDGINSLTAAMLINHSARNIMKARTQAQSASTVLVTK